MARTYPKSFLATISPTSAPTMQWVVLRGKPMMLPELTEIAVAN
jgi:hypothetical protein